MITIQHETIAEIPTLHVVKADLSTQARPTVFFLHGYTSAKEHNLHYAYLLADKGFRVLLPEALHHGEREQELVGKERDLSFWNIVIQSIKELELLKNHFVAQGLTIELQIGVMGTSMGAITTYGALTQYPWIHTAVSLMGTAYYQAFAEGQLEMLSKSGIEWSDEAKNKALSSLETYDLSKQIEKLAGRPLMIWHGERDQVVPYRFSPSFYQLIQKQYEEQPEKLLFISDSRADHKVSREAVLMSVEWFETHLLKDKIGVSHA
ncbi:prolyl oligopeptidase family serine peptidase [Halalkalibacterium ligniniphilum]|uniref:prolyl oligopeptidase family serine peptidase n=1 Tax=Halalkalibacterium ligniniphilum TaxID=1134413 RepID=UPI000345856C|nr:alpha/beta hydrolase [Halalkalibacterium ligniniphilum]